MDPTQFSPFNPQAKLVTYTRNLPHWRQVGASYFVTFHLADSLPQAQRAELKILRQQRETLLACNSTSTRLAEGTPESLSLEIQQRIEKWLDAGYGSCVLSRPKVLAATVAALTHFHGKRYHLIGYVVMPNHCHLVLQPLGDAALESILRSRKSFIAREANRLSGTRGTVWHEESYDRIIRGESHMYLVIRYIENNPSKARVSPDKIRLGISNEWRAWYEQRKGEPSRFTVF